MTATAKRQAHGSAASGLRRWRCVALAAALSVLATLATPVGAQPATPGLLSPSQAAFLQAENKRIEDYFVTNVARLVGISDERVRRSMPDERRITVAVERLIAALEMDLGQALSEEQKALIRTADEARRAALVRVRQGASQR